MMDDDNGAFAAFELLCRNHDWFYERSDDARTYQRGWDNHARIKALRRQLFDVSKVRTDLIFFKHCPSTNAFGCKLNEQTGDLLDVEEYRLLERAVRKLGPALVTGDCDRAISLVHLIENHTRSIRGRQDERDYAAALQKESKRVDRADGW